MDKDNVKKESEKLDASDETFDSNLDSGLGASNVLSSTPLPSAQPVRHLVQANITESEMAGIGGESDTKTGFSPDALNILIQLQQQSAKQFAEQFAKLDDRFSEQKQQSAEQSSKLDGLKQDYAEQKQQSAEQFSRIEQSLAEQKQQLLKKIDQSKDEFNQKLTILHEDLLKISDKIDQSKIKICVSVSELDEKYETTIGHLGCNIDETDVQVSEDSTTVEQSSESCDVRQEEVELDQPISEVSEVSVVSAEICMSVEAVIPDSEDLVSDQAQFQNHDSKCEENIGIEVETSSNNLTNECQLNTDVNALNSNAECIPKYKTAVCTDAMPFSDVEVFAQNMVTDTQQGVSKLQLAICTEPVEHLKMSNRVKIQIGDFSDSWNFPCVDMMLHCSDSVIEMMFDLEHISISKKGNDTQKGCVVYNFVPMFKKLILVLLYDRRNGRCQAKY